MRIGAAVANILLVALGISLVRLWPVVVAALPAGRPIVVQVFVQTATAGVGSMLVMYGLLKFYIVVFRSRRTKEKK